MNNGFPNFPIAYAQTLPTPLTFDEKSFLVTLEVQLRLAKNAPEDRRYLLKVKETIDGYMKKNAFLAFPHHMSSAIDLMTTYLSDRQWIDLEHGVPQFHEPHALSENCFYHQLDAAVEYCEYVT